MRSYVFHYDRNTGKVEQEKVYGGFFIEFFYGNKKLNRYLSKLIRPLVSRMPFFSWLYAFFQRSSYSKKKVRPFVEKYQINHQEFEKSLENFSSFNDFFTRKLKTTVRPVHADPKQLCMPADGRYLICPNVSMQEGFFIKGQKFDLSSLLKEKRLIEKYDQGSLVLARLAPVDYHRFHFPCDGYAKEPKLFSGQLYSVNPLALRKRLKILWQNKRVMTEITTEHFGDILYLEVGATLVGSIQQTFKPKSFVKKGEEKGFFQYGGSSLVLLFEKDRVKFTEDLVKYSKEYLEVKAQLGEPLGVARTLSI